MSAAHAPASHANVLLGSLQAEGVLSGGMETRKILCASLLKPLGLNGSLHGGEEPVEGEKHQRAFYDDELVRLSSGDRELFHASLNRECFMGRGMDAQSRTGVTILMRVCRNIGIKGRCRDLGNLELLLEKNCNPLVCCDSGKNCFHDLFWGSSSLVDNDNAEAAMMLKALEIMLLRFGLETSITLLMAKDNHSFTPLDYLSNVNRQDVTALVLSQLRALASSKTSAQDGQLVISV